MVAAETSSKGCLSPSRTALKLSNAAALPCPPSSCCSIHLHEGRQTLTKRSHSLLRPTPSRVGFSSILRNSASRQELTGSGSHGSHAGIQETSPALGRLPGSPLHPLGLLRQWEPNTGCKFLLMRIPLWEPRRARAGGGNQTGAGGRMYLGIHEGNFKPMEFTRSQGAIPSPEAWRGRMHPGGTLSLRTCTTQVPENITKQGPSLSQKTCCHKVTRIKKKQKELRKGFKIPDQKKIFFKDRNFLCSPEYLGTF